MEEFFALINHQPILLQRAIAKCLLVAAFKAGLCLAVVKDSFHVTTARDRDTTKRRCMSRRRLLPLPVQPKGWRLRKKTHASSPSTSGKTHEKTCPIQTRRETRESVHAFGWDTSLFIESLTKGAGTKLDGR